MKKKQLLALVQHPMWLLIKEDSKCHERTPPWGAPMGGRGCDPVFLVLKENVK